MTRDSAGGKELEDFEYAARRYRSAIKRGGRMAYPFYKKVWEKGIRKKEAVH